ncbi:MAG: MBL fold metallo-hydrolase [Phycisphaeraceae bacterium]|nr:MBL fold metallo-hydrolase [Phycisphaeraceae bacterium]
MDFRVISIGTLPAHPLWGERAGASVRTGHATTTLIRAGKRVILVDPGLPEQHLAARLGERAGLSPKDVTHVFLTCFKPDARRALGGDLGLLDHATWWVSELERESVGVPMVRRLQEAVQNDDPEMTEILQRDVAILKRCEAAPDRLADGVDLFPLPGHTPGMCGVLLGVPGGPRTGPKGPGGGTLLVCGDAVPTQEHLERGMVLHGSLDVDRAQESFREAIEIADLLIPGRDNLLINPVRRGF